MKSVLSGDSGSAFRCKQFCSTASDIIIGLIVVFLMLNSGCREKYTPKPHGYFRISFPEKSYRLVDSIFQYKFEIPVYSRILKDQKTPDKPDWINIVFPANKAEIHLSYYQISQNSPQVAGQKVTLAKLIEDSRELAYKHTIKADAIDEQLFMNPSKKVFGIIYLIEGNAASPMQFFLTDSTANFLRGSLYISDVPNIDSIRPVIDFLRPDIIRLMESTSWKK